MGYLQNLIKKIETVEKQMHTEMRLHSPVAIEVLKNRCIEAISKIKDANNKLIPYGAKSMAIALVRASTPPFDASYAQKALCALVAPPEDMLIITP